MGSIGPTLQRLEERDLARHKDTDWAIAQDDRITGFESTISSVRAVSQHDDEWGISTETQRPLTSQRSNRGASIKRMNGHLSCEVVTHPATFQPYNRPYVIVSRNTNPDYPDQYIALGISTTDTQDNIPINTDDCEGGQLSKKSYIVPRDPTVLLTASIKHTVSALSLG